MTTPQQDELRKKILAVDTTHELDEITIEQFLPPNFYIDRLVTLIATEIEKAENRARLDELKGVQLEYGHYNARVWSVAQGDFIAVTDRIKQLKEEEVE